MNDFDEFNTLIFGKFQKVRIFELESCTEACGQEKTVESQDWTEISY